MGSMPLFLEAVLPRSGAVPPNSPVVVHGYIPGELAVTARAGEIDLGVVLEDPPAFVLTPGASRDWLVRPAAGDWPAGATIVLTATCGLPAPVVMEIRIAEHRDETAPVFSSISLPKKKVIGGLRQPSYEMVLLEHQPFTDDASALIVVTLEASGAVLRTTTREGTAGTLRMPPGGARALDAITLADLAGNSVRIANPCTEAAAPIEAPAAPPMAAFTCVAGTLVEEDGWFVGATDGTENGFSRGHYRATSAPDGDIAISVTATRLTDEPAMPIEIAFRGGYFGVTSTSLWYLYEHDGHWTGWQPTPSPVGSGPLTLRVEQRGAEVKAFVNGDLAGSMTLEKPATGPVGVFFKGPPGAIARMRFRDFVAESP